jgi:hypothetical protein
LTLIRTLFLIDICRQGEASQIATAARLRQKNAIIVKKIFEENKFCAECEKPDPDWLSLNLGCLICIDCSGVHRFLFSTYIYI